MKDRLFTDELIVDSLVNCYQFIHLSSLPPSLPSIYLKITEQLLCSTRTGTVLGIMGEM